MQYLFNEIDISGSLLFKRVKQQYYVTLHLSHTVRCILDPWSHFNVSTSNFVTKTYKLISSE